MAEEPRPQEIMLPTRAVIVTRAAPLILVILLSGCATGGSLSPCPSCVSNHDARATSPEGQSNSASDPDKPAPPRTLPQALCAYWRALRSCPCASDADQHDKEAKNGGESAGANGKGKPTEGGVGETDKKQFKSDKPAEAGSDQEPKTGEKSTPDTDNGESEKDKEEKKNGDEEVKETWFSAHAQTTMITQLHGPFPALYTGPRSLLPNEESATSLTATLFLTARLWQCDNYTGEMVFDPEIAGGKGFSGVNGIGGFTNGDITRVGVPEPTPYFARWFLRQTWGLGGEKEKIEDAPNQIAGKQDVDRITFTAGKFAFTDVIDNNEYSHDPRSQMQNWSLMYNGAWDYPANVRGYSYGLAIDYNQKDWALRYVVMAEPTIANGAPIDPHFTKAFGQALEWEGRWKCNDHIGRVRLMTYANRAHMGDYQQALAEMPIDPDVTQTRAYRFKYGFGMNFQQEINRDLGVWGRLGWSDGHTETWAFTPIDRTAALGLLLVGRCWARPNDNVGLAAACNGLAKDHRDYLASGGLDFSIGDGALNYGREKIIETYYRFAIIKGMYVYADFQEIWNPAYNRDRGPVSVESLLVHFEF